MLGSSWLAEELLASQEGMYVIELDNYTQVIQRKEFTVTREYMQNNLSLKCAWLKNSLQRNVELILTKQKEGVNSGSCLYNSVEQTKTSTAKFI